MAFNFLKKLFGKKKKEVWLDHQGKPVEEEKKESEKSKNKEQEEKKEGEQDQTFTKEDEEKVKERLRSLGYLD